MNERQRYSWIKTIYLLTGLFIISAVRGATQATNHHSPSSHQTRKTVIRSGVMSANYH
jgi:hypothetical protein